MCEHIEEETAAASLHLQAMVYPFCAMCDDACDRNALPFKEVTPTRGNPVTYMDTSKYTYIETQTHSQKGVELQQLPGEQLFPRAREADDRLWGQQGAARPGL